MLQIHKIYIENFKGIHLPNIIDFDDKQLTILSGPNGFGKTTIFDVMELCLRGRLHRTMTYNHVTKKNAGHKKPFYQNTTGEDVLLKVWLKDNERDHVIIKKLDRNSEGSRNNSKSFRPDAWDLIDTFYTNDSSGFNERPDYTSLEEIDQTFIDNLFFGDDSLSMENLYPLFNYLQQEDNIYFLKKDEDTKKNELAFLFQTQKESEDLEKISNIHSTVIAVRDSLATRIRQLGTVVESHSDSSYTRLFPETDYAFDSENPFLSTPTDRLESAHIILQDSVQQLLEFVRTFSPQEFQRRKLRTQFTAVINNRLLLESLVAKNLLTETRFSVLREKISANTSFRNYLPRLQEFVVEVELLGRLGFIPEFVQEFTEAVSDRQRLLQQIGEIGRIIRELNLTREQTMMKFDALHEVHPQNSNCPFCDAEWDSLEILRNAYVSKTDSLESYHRSQQSELSALELEIRNNFINQATQALETYLASPENLIDPNFYQHISERRGNLESINRFMGILANEDIDVANFLIDEPVTLERFNQNIASLETALRRVLDGISVDETRLTNSELFTQYFSEDPARILPEQSMIEKQIYLTARYNATRNLSLSVLTDRLSRIQELETRIHTVNANFSACIKAYKKLMIEKIKIPFYIYSGKILQHYQQGYGIFVDVKDSTSRVRFLTGESTDHDIIHQLSSGQLAVVSIAFCLALNKVYEAQQHFKFLAIDDPVQTLDDLNIHSFIELLRHEFSDYKMVISTHEEHIANYLLYKFEKFQFESKKINVQQSFYMTDPDQQ